MKLNVYHRPDAVDGVGYVIDHAGRQQHSVSWPDRPAQRFRADELQEHGITVDAATATCLPDCSDDDAVPQPAVTNQDGKPTVTDQDGQAAVTVDRKSIEPTPPKPETTGTTPSPDAEGPDLDASESEAENIRRYLRAYPDAENGQVIDALDKAGIEIQSSQVNRQRKKLQG